MSRIDELAEATKRTMERHWEPLTAMAWADSGGPSECAHGVAAGLPCGRCYADYGEKADPPLIAALIECYRMARNICCPIADQNCERSMFLRSAIERVEALG